MTSNRIAFTAAFLTATALASAPAFAQEAQRDYKKRESARAAQEAAPRNADRAQPRRESPAPRNEPRREENTPRVETHRDDVVGRAAPRTERPAVVAPRYNDRREYDRRYYDSDRHYSYSPRYVPRTYYRPYVFRPRLSIGFGIFAGYPVPYSYSYPYPIEVYGYRAPRASVMVGPGSGLYGGVALEIAQYDADVFVDGSYAGHVEDFDGTSQPLTLVAGTHRVEVQASGYTPLVFDVVVTPGQVIPYRGELRPY